MTIESFDLCDLATGESEHDERSAESETDDVTEWATGIVEKAIQREADAGPVFYDIETGPRPWEEIEAFYQGPEPLPPWDESMVKYGNAKREELRAEKREEHKRAYQILLDSEGSKAEAHKAEWLTKVALSPVTGRVLLIGITGIVANAPNEPASLYNDDEAIMLDRFWGMVDGWLTAKRPIIGHNSNGFDLPFLIRRSWCLGVPVPREVRQGRYWNPLFRDTMEFWNCGARDYVKLNTLAEFFGVGQKTEGVQGGDFSKLWYGQMPAETWGTPEDQRLKALEYNAQDLRLTASIAAKMGMV